MSFPNQLDPASAHSFPAGLFLVPPPVAPPPWPSRWKVAGVVQQGQKEEESMEAGGVKQQPPAAAVLEAEVWEWA